MKGYILTVPVTGQTTIQEVETASILDHLKAGIGGGYLEAVPYFNKIAWDTEVHRCVAFCDEEGKLKGLPINNRANVLWTNAVGEYVSDVLVGDVVIVWGDEEFMSAL